jgi:hypothetical protein
VIEKVMVNNANGIAGKKLSLYASLKHVPQIQRMSPKVLKKKYPKLCIG